MENKIPGCETLKATSESTMVFRIATFTVSFSMLLIALASSAETKAVTVSFKRDVRPILSDRCFRCHGPDKRHREAELRLDQADGDDTPQQVYFATRCLIESMLSRGIASMRRWV